MGLSNKFSLWYTFERMNVKKAHKDLFEMLNELEAAPRLYKPSIYWQNINNFHIKHITNYGMKYFKRSLNREYFEWGVSEFRHQLSPIFSELRRGNIQPVVKSKLIDSESKYATSAQFSVLIARWFNARFKMFSAISNNWFKPFNKLEFLAKVIYRIYVAYLYHYVRRIDHLGLLNRLSEPRVGEPLLVSYHGSLTSQDLCNSVHEFYSITEGANIHKQNFSEIAELGAGYGRLAYVFLKVLPNINYCIIDIPPALYIAQEYLKTIFPKEKIFLFRRFNRFEDVERDFRKARIKFLLPHQIEYLPKDYFDVMINISSFHEMKRDQIKNYLKQIDRLTKGYFYSKQWKKSRAKDNNFIREDKYPIPSRWKHIYHHTHPIQNLFFEALYKTRNENP